MYLMLNLSATIILEYCDYKTSEKAENKNYFENEQMEHGWPIADIF